MARSNGKILNHFSDLSFITIVGNDASRLPHLRTSSSNHLSHLWCVHIFICFVSIQDNINIPVRVAMSSSFFTCRSLGMWRYGRTVPTAPIFLYRSWIQMFPPHRRHRWRKAYKLAHVVHNGESAFKFPAWPRTKTVLNLSPNRSITCFIFHSISPSLSAISFMFLLICSNLWRGMKEGIRPSEHPGSSTNNTRGMASYSAPSIIWDIDMYLSWSHGS